MDVDCQCGHMAWKAEESFIHMAKKTWCIHLGCNSDKLEAYPISPHVGDSLHMIRFGWVRVGFPVLDLIKQKKKKKLSFLKIMSFAFLIVSIKT